MHGPRDRTPFAGSGGRRPAWYVVNPADIAASSKTSEDYVRGLAQARREPGHENADEIGRMLIGENLRSVCHRYPDVAA